MSGKAEKDSNLIACGTFFCSPWIKIRFIGKAPCSDTIIEKRC